jgi:plastocyanin
VHQDLELLGSAAWRGTVAGMHAMGVASAAWVFAAAPSKFPFYVSGGVLACGAVALAAFGITHPDFPGSDGRARLVMAATALLVVATMTTGVVTAGRETAEAGAPAASTHTLRIAADPSGRLAFDRRQAAVDAGRVRIDFTNRAPVAHDVTIARGTKVVVATKPIQGASATVTADLARGTYVFFCSVDGHRQAGMQGTLSVR